MGFARRVSPLIFGLEDLIGVGEDAEEESRTLLLELIYCTRSLKKEKDHFSIFEIRSIRYHTSSGTGMNSLWLSFPDRRVVLRVHLICV
jgi:hypothetical protein